MHAFRTHLQTLRRALLVGVLRLMVVRQRRADRKRWPAPGHPSASASAAPRPLARPRRRPAA